MLAPHPVDFTRDKIERAIPAHRHERLAAAAAAAIRQALIDRAAAGAGGDADFSWRLSSWLDAFEAGVAPPVVLEATHEQALDVIPLELLRRYAVDVPDDLSAMEG